MTDRPIIFSGPMVRALLAGTKTQTRRAIRSARVFATPESRAFTLTGGDLSRALQGASRFRRLDGDGWFWEADAFEWQAPATRTGWMAHIGFAPGDRLWVRERLECANGEAIGYPADGTWFPNDHWRWARQSLPSIHMPRAYSRLTLTVTKVRVEQLQEISEEDALAEGVPAGLEGNQDDEFYCPKCRGFGVHAALGHNYGVTEVDCRECETARQRYRHLWERINGAGSWEPACWVAAYTFSVEHANIDALANRPVCEEG